MRFFLQAEPDDSLWFTVPHILRDAIITNAHAVPSFAFPRPGCDNWTREIRWKWTENLFSRLSPSDRRRRLIP